MRGPGGGANLKSRLARRPVPAELIAGGYAVVSAGECGRGGGLLWAVILLWRGHRIAALSSPPLAIAIEERRGDTSVI